MPFYYYGYDLRLSDFCIAGSHLCTVGTVSHELHHQTLSKNTQFRGMTGCAAARAIFRTPTDCKTFRLSISAGISRTIMTREPMSFRLSDAVYNSDSATAVGIAAHEAGHAIQHAQDMCRLKFAKQLSPVTSICSNLSMPLILLGLLFSFPSLAYIGVILFGASTVFQLVTLPVEFNASARAIRVLDEYHYLEDDELRAAKNSFRRGADLCCGTRGFLWRTCFGFSFW